MTSMKKLKSNKKIFSKDEEKKVEEKRDAGRHWENERKRLKM